MDNVLKVTHAQKKVPEMDYLKKGTRSVLNIKSIKQA